MTFDRAALLLSWAVLLLVVLVLARVLRLLRANETVLEEARAFEAADELEVGAPAPAFHARYLDGSPAGLAQLPGRPVLLLFVSPACATCRREMRDFNRLSRTVAERIGMHTVLVTDQKAARTDQWITVIEAEDGVTVQLPVIPAPPRESDLLLKYNPSGVMPSFCVVGADGAVASRGRVGNPDWFAQRATWEGRAPAARPRDLRRATG